MNTKDIEARLDRSLANQIAAPRLDRRFDAAVWARIAAEKAKAANPVVVASGSVPSSTLPSRAERLSRWLAITNAIGITVTLGVALYFVLRTYGGLDLAVSDVNVSVPVSVPVIPDDMLARITGVLGQVLGFAALAFGLSFTSLGRRVRASFS